MGDRCAIRIRGDFIGYIEGDTYHKDVYGSRHKLRVPEAWSLDADTYDKIIRPAVVNIVLTDKETGKRYITTTKYFDINKGEIDRGYGRQYFMVLRYWVVR